MDAIVDGAIDEVIAGTARTRAASALTKRRGLRLKVGPKRLDTVSHGTTKTIRDVSNRQRRRRRR